MTDYEKEIAAQEELIGRRKRALARKRDRQRESPGEEAGAGPHPQSGAQATGILSERQLRKLIKQAQRRKAKLAKDRARRAGAAATADER